MTRVFYFLIFLLIFNDSFAQDTSVLEKLDLTNNDYQLYFFHHKDRPFIISKEYSNFIIEDKKKIDELKENWIGTSTFEVLECGYDYTIYIVENKNTIVAKLKVNQECGQVIATGKGTSVEFQSNPFKNLIIDKKSYATVLASRDIDKSRRLLKLIEENNNVHFSRTDKMNWINYDGRFHFIVSPVDSDINKDSLINQIKSKYSKHNFSVDLWGFSSDRIDGYIFSDSTLYNKLKIEKPQWKDFYFNLGTDQWKSWENVKSKRFQAFVFSDDKKAIDDLKKAANNVYNP